MLANEFAIHERVLPNGRHKFPSKSCSRNLPTRVPASSVVRINNASNMMAK